MPRNTHWPSACIEGKIAGLNMAGKKTEIPGEINYNILPVFDQIAAFAEKREADHPEIEVLKYVNKKKGIYRKILVKRNRIVGAVSLGEYRDAGIFINLIKKRVDISRVKQSLTRNALVWGKVLNFSNRSF